jgi:hypothetical protein
MAEDWHSLGIEILLEFPEAALKARLSGILPRHVGAEARQAR